MRCGDCEVKQEGHRRCKRCAEMEMRFVLAADSAKAKQVGDVALSAETVIGRAPKGAHTHVLPGDWVQISSTHCRIYKVRRRRRARPLRAPCYAPGRRECRLCPRTRCLPVRRPRTGTSSRTSAQTVRTLVGARPGAGLQTRHVTISGVPAVPAAAAANRRPPAVACRDGHQRRARREERAAGAPGRRPRAPGARQQLANSSPVAPRRLPLLSRMPQRRVCALLRSPWLSWGPVLVNLVHVHTRTSGPFVAFSTCWPPC